jgi:hypothetical protein
LSLARKPAKFCQPQKFPFSEIAWRKTMGYYHVRRWNIFFSHTTKRHVTAALHPIAQSVIRICLPG